MDVFCRVGRPGSIPRMRHCARSDRGDRRLHGRVAGAAALRRCARGRPAFQLGRDSEASKL